MSSISRRVAVSRCRRPTGCGGRAGQRDVDDVGGEPRVELGALELGAARPRSRPRAPGAPRWRRLPTAPRSSGGSCGDAAQQVRQLGLAAEEARRAPPRARRCAAARGDRGLARGPQLLRSGRSCARHPSALVERDRRRHRGVQRLRRGSGCGATSSHAATTRVGQPLALGADHQRHVALARSSASGAALARRPARPAGPGSSATAAHARHRHGEHRAHRGAHGLVRRTGRRCRGRARRCRRRTPARSAAPCRRCRGRRRPTAPRTAGPAGAGAQRCG